MSSAQTLPGSDTKTGWALAVIVTGVLVAAVDTTIVILALPTMMRFLHANLADIIWVIMAYLLVITLLATQVGRLGDMFGRVRMYELGFLVFVLGSFLCGVSTTETALIGFRVLQGIGRALISANSGAVITDTFPPGKTRASLWVYQHRLEFRRHPRYSVGRSYYHLPVMALHLSDQCSHWTGGRGCRLVRLEGTRQQTGAADGLVGHGPVGSGTLFGIA